MPTGKRHPSIDALRGLVMVLMALDHARDFFTPLPFDGTDVSQTTPGWFFARWVTHLCAPVFVFLAGTAAWMKGRRDGPEALSRWLFVRGAWLIVLELTLNNALWFATLWKTYLFLQVQVLWAIGVSMIGLGVLCRWPRQLILVFTAVVLLGHNLLDPIRVAAGEWTVTNVAWSLLHQPNNYFFAPKTLLTIGYPLLPWVGVITAGYLFGEWYVNRENRARAAFRLGLSLCLAFVLLRWINVYGDPRPWSASPRGTTFTLLDFLACTKYPASLAYLAMTLGIALLALALFERMRESALRPLVVFGRVPLFFYFAHIAVMNVAALALMAWNGYPLAWWWLVLFGQSPEGYTPTLRITYVSWLAAVAVLYPVCVFWGRLKASGRHAWVAYL